MASRPPAITPATAITGKSGSFVPFMYDFESGIGAAEILNEFLKVPVKIALTYSANNDQTKIIYRNYNGHKQTQYVSSNIKGSGQAKLFASIETLIATVPKYAALKYRFHILPVTTCQHSGGAGGLVNRQQMVRDMINIALHLGAGYTGLGLRDPDTPLTSPASIAGGVISLDQLLETDPGNEMFAAIFFMQTMSKEKPNGDYRSATMQYLSNELKNVLIAAYRYGMTNSEKIDMQGFLNQNQAAANMVGQNAAEASARARSAAPAPTRAAAPRRRATLVSPRPAAPQRHAALVSPRTAPQGRATPAAPQRRATPAAARAATAPASPRAATQPRPATLVSPRPAAPQRRATPAAPQRHAAPASPRAAAPPRRATLVSPRPAAPQRRAAPASPRATPPRPAAQASQRAGSAAGVPRRKARAAAPAQTRATQAAPRAAIPHRPATQAPPRAASVVRRGAAVAVAPTRAALTYRVPAQRIAATTELRAPAVLPRNTVAARAALIRARRLHRLRLRAAMQQATRRRDTNKTALLRGQPVTHQYTDYNRSSRLADSTKRTGRTTPVQPVQPTTRRRPHKKG